MIDVIGTTVLLGVTHLLSFWAMTEPKHSARKTAAIYSMFCAAFVLLAVASYRLFGRGIEYYAVGFVSTITVSFLVFMHTSADATCKKVFLFISYADVFCIFVCISLIFCDIVFKNSSAAVISFARNIARTVLLVPTALLYMRFLRPTVRSVSGERSRTWYSISVVSALFLAIFALFLVIFYTESEDIGEYVLFLAITVLIYVSILWVIFGTIQSMISESNAQLVSRSVAYLQSQLKTAKENEFAAKTVRHDFRHHNRNIASMLRKGEVNEAIKYLEQYDESLEASKPSDFCQNITVNAILNSFYNKARDKGISVSIEADTADDTAIADMDFVAILSNLLENAVNGCAESKSDGEIKVNLRTVADKTVIVCSNPCKNDICIENNMIKNRGIGIAGMLSAIRKYDGDIGYSLDNGILTACIILNSRTVQNA